MQRPAAAAIVLVLAACDRGARSEPGPAVTTGASVGAAVELVPAPLAWGLAEADAVARLAVAGMAPRTDELHAYVSTPGQFHAAPGTIEVAHTVEPVVHYVPAPGWTGAAHYEKVGGALDRIELTAHLDPVAAAAALRGLERRFGRPDDRRTYAPAVAGGAGVRRLVWVRGGAWLVASASPDGDVALAYRRDPRPASAIAW